MLFCGIFRTQEGPYAVFFPDFPQAITQGDTLDECLRLGADVLAIVVDEYAKERRELPQSATFEQAWGWAVEFGKDADLAQGVEPILQMFRVLEIDLSPVPISVSIAKSTLDEMDTKAGLLGMSRS